MKKALKVLPSLSVLLPGIALAQNFAWFTNIVTSLGKIVNALIPIAVSLALLVFIWGLAQFILASGDEGAKDEGKRRMIWGVVALFCIVSIWGIIAVMQNIFGVTASTQTTFPTGPTP